MISWVKASSAGWLAALVVVTTGAPARAQDSLATARDLYASAAYEDALSLLNRLRASDARSEEGRAIEQYRAFCLLALGRASEAERAIEAVVTAAPSYHLTDASPRVRSAFTDVRRRVLPAIVQQTYTQAKAAFDRQDFAAAADGFSQVLALVADPDVAPAASQPPLSDLRLLATGFRDLSAKAVAPPPPPPLAAAPVEVAPPPPPPPAPMPATPRTYGAEDANVMPPLIVRQALPPYPNTAVPSAQGVLEIIIDESGAVEAATMKIPVTAVYDRLAIAATRSWRYKPATVNGVAVKYRKNIQITLKATQ